MRALVTGGAGFIGSNLVDALVLGDHEVFVLDNLEPGVHRKRPAYLNPGAEYFWKDVRDAEAVREALQGVTHLFHLASLIDVEESMREPARYADVNVRGTATLLDEAAKQDSLERMVLASSVAVYGEGSYNCLECGPVEPLGRPEEQLESGEWEVRCPQCGRPLEPRATSEEKRPAPLSTYGITKLTQEMLFEAAARHLGKPAAILRYANVYGRRQRPGPYSGVCVTFHSRMMEGEGVVVHEDGKQSRDFVSVDDVVRASILAAEAEKPGVTVANIGTGGPTTVLDLIPILREITSSDAPAVMNGTHRQGDIRHLWVDNARARRELGFTPTTDLRQGLEATFRQSS